MNSSPTSAASSYSSVASAGDHAGDAGAAHTSYAIRIQGSGERGLCAFVRAQAQRLLEWAMEEEVEEHLKRCHSLRDDRGRPAVVRNGLQPTRQLLTNLGPVPVRVPKVRSRIDRNAVFRSAIVRPYLRRSRGAVPAAPLQFLRGLSAGDMHGCLTALMGPEGALLASHSMLRLKQRWQDTYGTTMQGSLDQFECESLWLTSLDCAEFEATAAEAIIIAIGIDPLRHERLFTMVEYMHRGVEAWREVLGGLRARGLRLPGTLRLDEGMARSVAQALASVFPEVAAID